MWQGSAWQLHSLHPRFPFILALGRDFPFSRLDYTITLVQTTIAAGNVMVASLSKLPVFSGYLFQPGNQHAGSLNSCCRSHCICTPLYMIEGRTGGSTWVTKWEGGGGFKRWTIWTDCFFFVFFSKKHFHILPSLDFSLGHGFLWLQMLLHCPEWGPGMYKTSLEVYYRC